MLCFKYLIKRAPHRRRLARRRRAVARASGVAPVIFVSPQKRHEKGLKMGRGQKAEFAERERSDNARLSGSGEEEEGIRLAFSAAAFPPFLFAMASLFRSHKRDHCEKQLLQGGD